MPIKNTRGLGSTRGLLVIQQLLNTCHHPRAG